MTIEQFQTIITGEPGAIKEALLKERTPSKAADYLKQYEVSGHAVMDKTIRKDKQVVKDTFDKDGAVISSETIIEPVTRLALSYQKQIAQRSASFLCANPIRLDSEPGDDAAAVKMLAALKRVWEQAKLDYKTMDIAEKMFSETEVAELWYSEKADAEDDYWAGTEVSASNKFRMRLLAHSTGDELVPVWDEYGDLIAFGRGYKVGEQERFDVYTATTTYLGVKGEGGWAYTSETNWMGKLPVIYYKQDAPDWADVQSLIEQLEALISDLSDNNKYSGSPILLTTGEIKGFASKGESGKVIEGENGADAKYLTPQNATEAIELEFNKLTSFINSLTDTPDISFESMKGIGNVANYAMEIMFMGAHLKAARKAGPFGECVQRRINFLKTAISRADGSLKTAVMLPVVPRFEFFMPRNIQETVDVVAAAIGAGVLSKETGTGMTGLVKDGKAEWEKIQAEADTQNSAPSGLDRAMGGLRAAS